MFTRHISRLLAAHLDGQLPPEKVRQADLHLAQCPHCRDEREQVRHAMALLEYLPPVEAPEAIWSSIEQAFPQEPRRAPAGSVWRWALAASMALALAGAAWWRLAPPRTRWDVARLEGSPLVGAKPMQASAQVGSGDWIETDARSRAALQVGKIGSVEVAPNTRVRVITARSGEHRIALARGEIRARISAPPKLFFVETASATAVDLGCEYRLASDEEGSGVLEVSRGWVSFQWKGTESLVPAGASCRTRPRQGPGIPYFDDAPESLKQALDILGFEKGGNDALDIILSASRVRDTLTLWHLLPRVDDQDRRRVFDRIAALVPLPAGVSRQKALDLDPPTLQHWLDELAWTW